MSIGALAAATVAAALTLLPAGCATGRRAAPAPAGKTASPLRDSRQLVLVVADDWNAAAAAMQCYERDGPTAPWRPVGPRTSVTVGRTGLAWGRGLHGRAPLPGPIKREGDGKSPAGAFALPFAFGYAPAERAGELKLPYLPLTTDVVGVDDPNSAHYNRLVHASRLPAKDWTSAETMRRADGLYEWGVFVAHNTAPPAAGAGSCIFLHVWAGPGKPTAGCTAMDRREVLRLLRWLDGRARPALVQLPRSALRSLAGPWRLPEF